MDKRVKKSVFGILLLGIISCNEYQYDEITTIDEEQFNIVIGLKSDQISKAVRHNPDQFLFVTKDGFAYEDVGNFPFNRDMDSLNYELFVDTIGDTIIYRRPMAYISTNNDTASSTTYNGLALFGGNFRTTIEAPHSVIWTNGSIISDTEVQYVVQLSFWKTQNDELLDTLILKCLKE